MEKREEGRGHDKNLPVYRSAAMKRVVTSCFTSCLKDGKQQSGLQAEKLWGWHYRELSAVKIEIFPLFALFRQTCQEEVGSSGGVEG